MKRVVYGIFAGLIGLGILSAMLPQPADAIGINFDDKKKSSSKKKKK